MPPLPGTSFGATDPNPLPVAYTNECTDESASEAAANDLIELTLEIDVPMNADHLQFDFDFFTTDYRAGLPTRASDMFVAYLESKQFTGNIARDAASQPVTANSASLGVCAPAAVCEGLSPPQCALDPAALDGTGYEPPQAGASTGWLRSTQAVTPGETIRLHLYLYDAGDHLGDSAVLIDDFQWGLILWNPRECGPLPCPDPPDGGC